MICPYLKKTVMPICKAKKGMLMTPNIYELQYYCLEDKYTECDVFKDKERELRKEAKKEKKAPDIDANT